MCVTYYEGDDDATGSGLDQFDLRVGDEETSWSLGDGCGADGGFGDSGAG